MTKDNSNTALNQINETEQYICPETGIPIYIGKGIMYEIEKSFKIKYTTDYIKEFFLKSKIMIDKKLAQMFIEAFKKEQQNEKCDEACYSTPKLPIEDKINKVNSIVEEYTMRFSDELVEVIYFNENNIIDVLSFIDGYDSNDYFIDQFKNPIFISDLREEMAIQVRKDKAVTISKTKTVGNSGDLKVYYNQYIVKFEAGYWAYDEETFNNYFCKASSNLKLSDIDEYSNCHCKHCSPSVCTCDKEENSNSNSNSNNDTIEKLLDVLHSFKEVSMILSEIDWDFVEDILENS